MMHPGIRQELLLVLYPDCHLERADNHSYLPLPST